MKNHLHFLKQVTFTLFLILSISCSKNNNNNPSPSPSSTSGIVIKGHIAKQSTVNKSTNALSLADAAKVLVFSRDYSTLTDIVNGSFSVSGQISSSIALIFLDATNHYIGNLSPQGLNMLPLGNLKNGENTQIDLSTLTMVGTNIIPAHDPLGNEIIISPSEINSLKAIGQYYQSIAKNIDADNDGIPDILSNKQLVISTLFARYTGHWGINNTPPVVLDDAHTYTNYSIEIQGGSAQSFANGNIVLSGPSLIPYNDISTWWSQINTGGSIGFMATFNRQTSAPTSAPWGTSFQPFKMGTYTVTLDGTKKYTLDYSNIDAQYNLVIVSPTLHTNSDGKVTSITFEYKLPNGTTINPASMLTNVMVQCTDKQMTQFYNSPKLTVASGLMTLTPSSPIDISTLTGIDVWYDDLLGNQYNIIWR
jgi:hypothetical protein